MTYIYEPTTNIFRYNCTTCNQKFVYWMEQDDVVVYMCKTFKHIMTVDRIDNSYEVFKKTKTGMFEPKKE